MKKENASQCESNDSQVSTQKKQKMKKVVKIIADVLFYIVLAIIVVVLICSVVDKFSGEESYPFFGYRGMVVLSNSMSFKYDKEFLEGHDEQFKKDDLIFTRKLKKGEEPELYDIVTFKLGEKEVAHRIIEIKEENGVKYYITRGDANPTDGGADEPKTKDQIMGIYVANWGAVGKVVKFVQSLYGMLSLIACLTIITIAYAIIKYGDKGSKSNSKTKKAVVASSVKNDSQAETVDNIEGVEIKEDNSGE